MRSDTAKLRNRHLPRRDARGFTLIEMLITVTILVVVMGGVAAMVYLSSKSKTANSQRIESAQGARVALDRMANDLRSAGYGADISIVGFNPQPQIAYIDSTQVLINANLVPAPAIDTATVTLGANLSSAPRAYDPVGSPRPFPLDGTAWQPPTKYRTGAEVIRYTLDANNDGVVDASDLVAANGSLAGRTPNPDDFVLLRQVYGDSATGAAGNNGGQTEQIALVRKPGGSVPPMFTVYMKGSTTPYDWANGPVPAAQLSSIERISVQVDAPSAARNSKGQYAETILSTQVNSMRNIPNFGATQYAVSGYVFDDTSTPNLTKDAGEPGLSDVRVTLGNYSAYTDNTGFFIFHVFPGNYTLRHVPPSGFTTATSPDSFRLNVNTSMTRSFADRGRAGGKVHVFVYEDQNDNHVLDAGEPGIKNIVCKESPDSSQGVTDVSGWCRNLFASPGNWSVSLSLPDSFIVNTTPYPVTGTMINGDSAFVRIGLKKSLTGFISGKVFRDSNRDGVWQSGETGIQNVWVGVTNDGGYTTLGYAYTDASGNYNIQVPINDPPHTKPYGVYFIPPGGNFPTTPTSINGLWVQTAATVANNNFGVAGYTVITLNANRVLSLASADLIEKDWNGNQTQNAHGDTDLILGADAGSTDNISVWFNQYNSTPLFAPAPTDPNGYTRLAPQSVMSIAVDTLDSDPTWKKRPDVVTGTKVAAAGNLFVWLTQNTSGNLGYLPTAYSQAYRTNDGGDVQSVLTLDCAGGAQPDIIAGTKSLTAGSGTIEIWQNSDAATPTFTRSEIYPGAGAIPGGRLGEVNAMILSDLDNDGRKDLVVGTKTGPSSGEIVVFKNVSKVSGARFVCVADYAVTTEFITALAALDLNGDGFKDIVAGTQTPSGGGNLMVWQSTSLGAGNWVFTNTRTQAAQGIVLSLTAQDLGGSALKDLAVGWRATPTSFVGGVDIYFTDVLGLPVAGTDPSAGSIANMVPALTTGNFNFGTNPAPSPPYLLDLAAGVKISSTTGALVVFIR